MVIMKTLAEDFLSQREQEQIREAVWQAEARTSGEIVPLISSCSHEYAGASLRGALALSVIPAVALAYWVVSAFWLKIEVLWFFLLFMVVLLPLSRLVVNRMASLKKVFLASSQSELEVERSAFTEFFAEGLHHTRDQNGVLIYISIL